MTDEARVAAWSVHCVDMAEGRKRPTTSVAFCAGFNAGVAEGIRQAREAAANVDPIESALNGSDAAVWAIDALTTT